jgi:hypothetical protein
VTERDEADDLLDARRFVSLVVSSVRNPALQGTLNTLREPPGRDPDADLVQLPRWFHDLSQADGQMAARVITFAVDSALFDMMCVLDHDLYKDAVIDAGLRE